MGRVARDQLQAVVQGDGGDHRVGLADGLPGAVEVAGDAAGQLVGGVLELNHFLLGDGGEEILHPAVVLHRWNP